MRRPRSRFLTHPYPMWQECTFKELILLIILVVTSLFLFALVLSVFVGHFPLPLVLLVMGCFVYHTVLLSAKRFAKYKKGKPYNFILLDLSKRLGFGKHTRICQTGVWETRRTFGVSEDR